MSSTRTRSGTPRSRPLSTRPACRTSSGCSVTRPSTWTTEPPAGVFWSRMSASSHTRGHPFAKDQTRGVLAWLEATAGAVVNGRRVLDLEMSKVEQLAALRAAGFDVPRTLAVAGRDGLAAAARKLPVPFISQAQPGRQGPRRAAVRVATTEFDAYLAGPDYEPPVDGITLLQEYLVAAEPRITRAEIVGGEFIYAITADTARGGFQLCPADACAVSPGGGPAAAEPSLFALADRVRPPGHRPVPGLRRRARHRHRRLRVHRDRRRPAGDLRHQHDDQLQRRDRGGRADGPALPAVAAYLGRLLAAAAGQLTGARSERRTRCGSGTGCRFSAAGCATSPTRACRSSWPYLRDLARRERAARLRPVPDRRAEPQRHQGPPRAVAGLLDAGAGRGRGDQHAGADARGPAELPLAVADRQGAVHAGHRSRRAGSRSTWCRPGGRTRRRSTARRSTCMMPGTRAPRSGWRSSGGCCARTP